jgi:hypothetical protein
MIKRALILLFCVFCIVINTFSQTTNLDIIQKRVIDKFNTQKVDIQNQKVSFIQELINEKYLESSPLLTELGAIYFRKNVSNTKPGYADLKIEIIEICNNYLEIFKSKIDSLRNYNETNPDAPIHFSVFASAIFSKPPLILLFKDNVLYVVRVYEVSDAKSLYELRSEMVSSHGYEAW